MLRRVLTDEQWYQALRTWLGSHPGELYVRIDGLDSNRDQEHVRRVVTSFRGAQEWCDDYATLSAHSFESLALEDDDLFPGYDAFWVLRRCGAVPPSFDLCTSADWTLPSPRKEGNGLSSWGDVEAWMRENHSVLGLAHAHAVLTIEPLDE